MTDLGLNGKWTGTAIYGKGYGKYRNSELHFYIEINQDNEKINGIGKDTEGLGANPEPFKITGTVNNNEIIFIKKYPYFLDFKKGNFIVDKSKPGHNVIYSGVYNQEEQNFGGNWIVKMKLYLFGLIPLTFTGKGTWEMEKTS